MNSLRKSSATTFRKGGFTLVEILTVLAIMAILTVLIVPAIGPVLQSYNLNRAGSMVADEFTFARQTALTKNADVEVRFYQVGSSSNGTDLQYRAFRAFFANAITPAQAVPLDKVSYLPGQVIISSNVAFSTLLDYTNASRSGLTSGTDTLPGGTVSVSYVSFLFRATGGTSLAPVTGSTTLDLWYLTMYGEFTPTVVSTGLPKNYFSIQIDPVTGNERNYRP